MADGDELEELRKLVDIQRQQLDITKKRELERNKAADALLWLVIILSGLSMAGIVVFTAKEMIQAYLNAK